MNRICRTRLVEEALDQLGVGRELWLEDLHRRFAVQDGMLRQIHRTHASLAQKPLDLVVVDFVADHLVEYRR